MSETKTKLVFKKEIGLISWPCTISVPLDDGKREEQILTPRFRVLTQLQMAQIYAPPPPNLTIGSPDALLLDAAIDGFDGLKDDTGKPVDDAVAKASLLSIPYIVSGLIRGYSDMIGGRTAKN